MVTKEVPSQLQEVYMQSFVISGSTPLGGVVRVSGSKNSALPIMAACLMADGQTVLQDVPRLSDVDAMAKILGELGCYLYRHDDGDLAIEVQDENRFEVRHDLVKTIRASICLLGPLLAKRGKIIVSNRDREPMGDRPIGLHVRGLQKLGAELYVDGGNIIGTVHGRLKGCRMYLGGAQGPTVLATINVMCAAALAEGETVIAGTACDPEVSDCAELLNKMGARITGHGTPEIRIEGVERLTAKQHRIIPDRIEAGTLMIAAAITGGELTIKNCNLDHMISVVDQLEEVGVRLYQKGDQVLVNHAPWLNPVGVTTQPYPGFPTDLQVQLTALLCLADGVSTITELVFPDRFPHVGELNRMGAFIRRENSTLAIQGRKYLVGASVMASDLRASAALVLAGLAAKGETRIDRIYHIDRGYERLDEKLNSVGAQIKRVED